MDEDPIDETVHVKPSEGPAVKGMDGVAVGGKFKGAEDEEVSDTELDELLDSKH